jgi:hypothetical protein
MIENLLLIQGIAVGQYNCVQLLWNGRGVLSGVINGRSTLPRINALLKLSIVAESIVSLLAQEDDRWSNSSPSASFCFE